MKKHRTKSNKGRQKRQFEADTLNLPSLRLTASDGSKEAFSGEAQPAAQHTMDRSPEMIQQIIEKVKSI